MKTLVENIDNALLSSILPMNDVIVDGERDTLDCVLQVRLTDCRVVQVDGRA